MASESSDYSEQLIEEVRASKCLWNVSSNEYRDSFRKNNAWTGIAERLGLQGKEKEVKEKWKRLRDSYVRAKRANKSRSGDPATKRPKWQFYDAMSFLEPTMDHGGSTSNFQAKQRETNCVELDPDTLDSLDNSCRSEDSPAAERQRKAQKKRSTATDLGEVKKAFLKKLEEETQKQSAEELFGKMVGATLASLPKPIAINAKFRIQQVLYESELLAQNEDDNHSSVCSIE